jgi:hypothetical protein
MQHGKHLKFSEKQFMCYVLHINMFLLDDALLKGSKMLQQYMYHIHLVVPTVIYIISN